MSLRDRLEAKQRRRLSVPILVSDPSEDQAALNTLAIAYQAAVGREDESAKVLKVQVEEQAAVTAGHWAQVELQALPRTEWNAVYGAWQSVQVTDDGPEMVTDWAEALAPLLAESCVDPELRDEKWWAGQLARPEWSEGDTLALRLALLRLNVEAVDPQVPKD